MKVIVFDIHGFEHTPLKENLGKKHAVKFVDAKLSEHTVDLAKGFDAAVICTEKLLASLGSARLVDSFEINNVCKNEL